MPVNIEIQNLQTKVPLPQARLKATIRKILKREKIAHAHLVFVFVDNARIRKLNRQFLRHDYATDVLTFPSEGRPPRGEIVISAQMAKANARRFKSGVQEEIVLCMVHGILHLLGYDDHGAADIRRMRAAERKFLL